MKYPKNQRNKRPVVLLPLLDRQSTHCPSCKSKRIDYNIVELITDALVFLFTIFDSCLVPHREWYCLDCGYRWQYSAIANRLKD